MSSGITALGGSKISSRTQRSARKTICNAHGIYNLPVVPPIPPSARISLPPPLVTLHFYTHSAAMLLLLPLFLVSPLFQFFSFYFFYSSCCSFSCSVTPPPFLLRKFSLKRFQKHSQPLGRKHMSQAASQQKARQDKPTAVSR